MNHWIVEPSDEFWTVRNTSGDTWKIPVAAGLWSTVRAIVGTVLELEFAEHHLLAAQGDRIFKGLNGDEQEWAARTVRLLVHAEQVRQIVEEWPEGHQMMSWSELKQRAWSDQLIGDLLSPAAVLPNPHYDNGGSMVLFDTRKVLAAERTQEWRASTAQLRSQRSFRRCDPGASRKMRALGRQVAGLDPSTQGNELAWESVTAPSRAIRESAFSALDGFFAGRVWTADDLVAAAVAPVAVALGAGEVVESALGHEDGQIRALAARRVANMLAGLDRTG